MRTTHLAPLLLTVVLAGCAGPTGPARSGPTDAATTSPASPSPEAPGPTGPRPRIDDETDAPGSAVSSLSADQLYGEACYVLPGDPSPAVPARDEAVYVSGCLTGNKPRFEDLSTRAMARFRSRWAASTLVPTADLERCTDPYDDLPGYLTVHTDRGGWVALSRSPCGYLTYPTGEEGVDRAVHVTFAELGIADDLRRTIDGYFLSLDHLRGGRRHH